MPEYCYRYECPLSACNHERSPLFADEERALESLRAHLAKHVIADVIPLLLEQNSLTRYELSELAPAALRTS